MTIEEEIAFWRGKITCSRPASLVAVGVVVGLDLAKAHHLNKTESAQLYKRACEVVRHYVDCPSRTGHSDDDCTCDAVAFLRDLKQFFDNL